MNVFVKVFYHLPPTVPAFTPGGFHVNLNYFFGSARAYHCEAKPGTANRYRLTGVKAVLAVVRIIRLIS
jgi:hypothetical protein